MLVQASDDGLISSAASGVTTDEPPLADNAPLRAARRPNVILAPHVAWASDKAQQTLADQLVDNVANFVARRAVNPVRGAFRRLR